MLMENKKELTEAEVNSYADIIIICIGETRKACLTDCLDGTYWITPMN